MKVLDRLPIAEEQFLLNVHGEPLRLRPFQILIQVSISPFGPWDSRTPVIPALFDSGNKHKVGELGELAPDRSPRNPRD